MKVWKYQMEPGENQIQLPVGATPISVGWQSSGVVLWVLIPDGALPGSDAEVRTFLWVGTGHEFDGPVEFVGTTDGPGGFIWHVFEVVN